MTIVIEDGTGLSNAEAYRSVEDHKAYCDKRGIAYSDDDDLLEQQAYLAMDYLNDVYYGCWKGYPTTSTQALAWPRAEVPKQDSTGGYNGLPNFYDYQTVPTEIGDAQSQLMIRVATSPLAPDIARLKESVKIGPLSVTYNKDAPANPVYVAVDNKLAQFLYGMSSLNATVYRT